MLAIFESPVYANASGSCNDALVDSFGGGSGTAQDPYLICNRSQLERISTSLTSHYKLKSNIVLSSSQEWSPISGTFTGTLDGGYWTISGLTISTTSATSPINGGLFATLGNGASIKKLRFVDASLTINNTSSTNETAGVLAGKASGNVTISEVAITGSSVSGAALNTGLLIGDSYSNKANGKLTLDLIRISNSSVSSTTAVAVSGTGGVIGYSRSLDARRIAVENTTVSLTSSQTYPAVGGLVGLLYGETDVTQYIREVYIDADLSFSGSGGPNMGGIVGQVNTDGWLELSNSRFDGTITLAAGSFTGTTNGLIGWGGNSADHSPQTVRNTLMTGNLGNTLSTNGVSDLLPGQLYVPGGAPVFAGNITATLIAPNDVEITYKTLSDHRLQVGENVTITNASNSDLNATNVPVHHVINSKTFTIKKALAAAPTWDNSGSVTVRGASSEVTEVYYLRDANVINNLVANTGGGAARSTTQLGTLTTFSDASWKIADAASSSVTSTWELTDQTDPIWKINPGSTSFTSVNFPSLVWMDYWPVTLSAPTSVLGSGAGAGSAQVSWTAPQGPVIGYKVESSADGGSTWVTEIGDSGTSATSASISGLTPGASYSFRVSAISDSAFPSAASVASSAVLLGSNPAGPQNLSAVRISENTFRISWDPPANTGGLSITSYTLQVDKGNGFETVPHTGTSAEISGVSINSLWSFRVLATNVVGSSSYVVFTNTPPVPYSGPIVTSFSAREVVADRNNSVTLDGMRLSQVTELFIGATKLSFTRSATDQLLVSLPALAKGVYDLRMVYTGGGVITHQAAFTVVDAPSALPSRTLLFTNFAGDGFRLPAAASRGIRSAVSSLGSASKIVCVGSTSGTRATASDRRLALRRAQEACNLAKRLVPGVVTEVRANPASGIGARFRSVSITITGN